MLRTLQKKFLPICVFAARSNPFVNPRALPVFPTSNSGDSREDPADLLAEIALIQRGITILVASFPIALIHIAAGDSLVRGLLIALLKEDSCGVRLLLIFLYGLLYDSSVGEISLGSYSSKSCSAHQFTLLDIPLANPYNIYHRGRGQEA